MTPYVLSDLPEPSAEDRAQFDRFLERLLECKQQLMQLDRQREELDRAIKEITRDQLPKLLTKMNLSEFVTREGHEIVVKTKITASIPKETERAAQAFMWLTENGHGDLIKNRVSVLFGRGQDEIASSLAEHLAREYPEQVDNKKEVHHMTLSAFVREQLESEGAVDFPLEKFNVIRFEEAEVKLKGAKWK